MQAAARFRALQLDRGISDSWGVSGAGRASIPRVPFNWPRPTLAKRTGRELQLPTGTCHRTPTRARDDRQSVYHTPAKTVTRDR